MAYSSELIYVITLRMHLVRLIRKKYPFCRIDECPFSLLLEKPGKYNLLTFWDN